MSPRRTRLAAALLALLAAPVDARPVLIPAPRTATGTATDGSVLVSLIDAAGTRVQGLLTTDGAPIVEDRLWPIPAAGLTLDLAPQSAIAYPAATYYQLQVQATIGRERISRTHRVQIPPGSTPITLATLAAGAAVASADLLAGRLLPAVSGAAAGWGLVLDADLVASWTPPGIGGDAYLTVETDPLWAASPGAALTPTDLSAWNTAASLAASASQPGHTQAASTITGLAAVATSGAYANLSGTPTLPSGGISSLRAATWDAAATGVRPLLALGAISENLTWTAHGTTATGTLTADHVDLDVALPTSGAWYSVLRLTADCDCEMSVVGSAQVAVGMAPIRPGIGGTVLVLILALPDGAIIATVPTL